MIERPIFIFDFDDTLIPSSWLLTTGFVADGSQSHLQLRGSLKRLEAQAIATLESFLALGIVLIISNGDLAWLSLALSSLYPDFKAFLQEQQIPLISARERGAEVIPHNSLGWKALTIFEQLARAQDNGFRFPFLLSVGDGLDERFASRLVSEQLNIPCKTVKFLEAPSLPQLATQLEYVRTYAQWVCDCGEDVQIGWDPLQLSVAFQPYAAPAGLLAEQQHQVLAEAKALLQEWAADLASDLHREEGRLAEEAWTTSDETETDTPPPSSPRSLPGTEAELQGEQILSEEDEDEDDEDEEESKEDNNNNNNNEEEDDDDESFNSEASLDENDSDDSDEQDGEAHHHAFLPLSPRSEDKDSDEEEEDLGGCKQKRKLGRLASAEAPFSAQKMSRRNSRGSPRSRNCLRLLASSPLDEWLSEDEAQVPIKVYS